MVTVAVAIIWDLWELRVYTTSKFDTEKNGEYEWAQKYPNHCMRLKMFFERVRLVLL